MLAEAATERVAKLYDAATEDARAAGVFGSPSFVTGGELFWGDDRLEDALMWAQGMHPMQGGTSTGG